MSDKKVIEKKSYRVVHLWKKLTFVDDPVSGKRSFFYKSKPFPDVSYDVDNENFEYKNDDGGERILNFIKSTMKIKIKSGDVLIFIDPQEASRQEGSVSINGSLLDVYVNDGGWHYFPLDF